MQKVNKSVQLNKLVPNSSQLLHKIICNQNINILINSKASGNYRNCVIGFVGLMILPFLFTGCATSQRRESIPEVKQPDQAVKIYFVRNKAFVGSAINYELMLDGINFFSISVGKYTMIKVDPGKHLVGVRMFGGMTLTWKENRKEYDFKPNQSYYFLIKNNTTFSDSVVVIEPISTHEWEAISKESTYVAY